MGGLWVHVWTDGFARLDHCTGRGANLYRAPICTVRRSLPQMRACQECTTRCNHGVFFVDVCCCIFFAVSLSSCPGFCLCSDDIRLDTHQVVRRSATCAAAQRACDRRAEVSNLGRDSQEDMACIAKVKKK